MSLLKRGAGLIPALALLALVAGPAPAQQATGFGRVATQILTLDQDRLFEETLYGQRIRREIDAISTELAERNRVISSELAAEEQELTERRSGMTLDAFRALAEAFDDKVTRLREEQDERILDLQRRRDLERRGFTARVAPILFEIVQATGAVAILDERAVILSAEAIDVTDEAISRINTLLGDGSLPQLPREAAPDETPDAPGIADPAEGGDETPATGPADGAPADAPEGGAVVPETGGGAD